MLEDKYYIDPSHKDQGHIGLQCKNHPHLKWHTKNIAPIGCRTIYANQNEECNCTCADLELIKEPVQISEEAFEDAYEAEQDRIFSDLYDHCHNEPQPHYEENNEQSE